MRERKRRPSFVICIKNSGYPASLEVRKVYRRLPDPPGARRGYLRVIDESGEDYLYPREFFVELRLPSMAKRAFAGAI